MSIRPVKRTVQSNRNVNSLVVRWWLIGREYLWIWSDLIRGHRLVLTEHFQNLLGSLRTAVGGLRTILRRRTSRAVRLILIRILFRVGILGIGLFIVGGWLHNRPARTHPRRHLCPFRRRVLLGRLINVSYRLARSATAAARRRDQDS